MNLIANFLIIRIRVSKLQKLRLQFVQPLVDVGQGCVVFIAMQEYEYQMKECIPPITNESELKSVQEEKKKRSNIVTDDDGTHRGSKKCSSKKK